MGGRGPSPSSSDADPNNHRQSVFLQPEMLDKTKDLWEQKMRSSSSSLYRRRWSDAMV